LEALALDINQALSAENPASAGFFVFYVLRGTLPVTKSQEMKWIPQTYPKLAKKPKLPGPSITSQVNPASTGTLLHVKLRAHVLSV
jgi:hypothetical protein